MMSEGHKFGLYLRELRLRAGLTLREFSRQVDESPGNVSKIERGKLNAPDSVDKLKRFATVLGIIDESDQKKFFDIAFIDRRRIPDEFIDDEELSKTLPLVFRTLRGKPVDEDVLKELAELIRKN